MAAVLKMKKIDLAEVERAAVGKRELASKR
jgi:hypothetical protein